MDARNMTDLFELLPDPKRPLSIAARIADENIGHAPSRQFRRKPAIGGTYIDFICFDTSTMRSV